MPNDDLIDAAIIPVTMILLPVFTYPPTDADPTEVCIHTTICYN